KKVQRWCKKDKIRRWLPNCVYFYNQHMGGTDRMGQNINANNSNIIIININRIGIRGKKWWWCIFTWMLDVALNNAWVLCKESGINITNLHFRQRIAMYYLEKYGISLKNKRKRYNCNFSVLRYNNMSHLVKNVPNNTRRCVILGCSSVGRTECSKCDVDLDKSSDIKNTA
ncbi:hypothetical protein A3Q56_07377, partial [Intoshia linei]